MATVALVPVDRDNWRQVTKLKLAPGQEGWVAPNWHSIIEAIFEGYTSRAIVADGEIVGYLMTHVKPNDDVLYVVRLMLDTAHQNKGYGRAALQQVLDEGRQRPDIKLSRISFVPGNDAAKHLYSSLGYTDTGRIEDGEHIYDAVLTQDTKG
jgi:diamine N-acetyltransferase